MASDAFLCVPYSQVYLSEPDEFQAKAELLYLSVVEQVPDGLSCLLGRSLRDAQCFPGDLLEPVESLAAPQYFQAGLPVQACL